MKQSRREGRYAKEEAEEYWYTREWQSATSEDPRLYFCDAVVDVMRHCGCQQGQQGQQSQQSPVKFTLVKG